MRPLTRKQALEMAVKALWSDYSKLAVDASYHDTWLSDNPAAVNASKRRERIEAAVGEINKMIAELKK